MQTELMKGHVPAMINAELRRNRKQKQQNADWRAAITRRRQRVRVISGDIGASQNSDVIY